VCKILHLDYTFYTKLDDLIVTPAKIPREIDDWSYIIA